MTTLVPTLPRLDLVTVEQFMHAGVVTCDPTTPLAVVAQILADKHIHCVVVGGIERTRDGERLTWSAISDRDVMQALADARGDTTAGHLAAMELVTIELVEPVSRAAQLMAEHDVSHLVVADRGYPVGIISSLDV